MSDGESVIECLQQRLNGDAEFFSLLDAINAFEASYRNDRFAGDGDSLTLVGWPVLGDQPIFDLALARCIDGELFQFPTIVTASLKIATAPGEVFDSEMDERFGDWQRCDGQVHLACDDYSAADAFFTRLRNLPIVQKYGTANPTFCELKQASDEQMRDMAGKLADYFAEHGCPSGSDGAAG